MRRSLRPILLASSATVVLAGLSAPVAAKCTRLAYSVNDYGKEGPSNDAKRLLDVYIAKWTAERGIKTYKTGPKKVTCELYIDVGLFDEHTCKAEASVCWADTVPGKKSEADVGAITTGAIPAPAVAPAATKPAAAVPVKAVPAAPQPVPQAAPPATTPATVVPAAVVPAAPIAPPAPEAPAAPPAPVAPPAPAASAPVTPPAAPAVVAPPALPPVSPPAALPEPKSSN